MSSRVPDADLKKIEEWLKGHNVAASALGRQVCDDHSLVSRWRRDGPSAVTESKRISILLFIQDHPEGLPGYTATKRASRRFTPNAHKETRTFGGSSGSRSTNVPVPAMTSLNSEDDRKWLQNRAFSRSVPLVVVLEEMVSLGIRVTQEIEREEAITNGEVG